MWYRSKFFEHGAGIILILLVVFLTGKVGFLFRFIFKIIAALAKPVLLAGLFYYLFRPLVGWMEQIRIPKVAAILLTCLLFGGLAALFFIYVGNLVSQQLDQLINDLPGMVDSLGDQGEALLRQK